MHATHLHTCIITYTCRYREQYYMYTHTRTLQLTTRHTACDIVMILLLASECSHALPSTSSKEIIFTS